MPVGRDFFSLLHLKRAMLLGLGLSLVMTELSANNSSGPKSIVKKSCRSFIFDFIVRPIQGDQSVYDRPLAQFPLFQKMREGQRLVQLQSPNGISIETPATWSQPFGKGLFIVAEQFISRDSKLQAIGVRIGKLIKGNPPQIQSVAFLGFSKDGELGSISILKDPTTWYEPLNAETDDFAILLRMIEEKNLNEGYPLQVLREQLWDLEDSSWKGAPQFEGLLSARVLRPVYSPGRFDLDAKLMVTDVSLLLSRTYGPNGEFLTASSLLIGGERDLFEPTNDTYVILAQETLSSGSSPELPKLSPARAAILESPHPLKTNQLKFERWKNLRINHLGDDVEIRFEHDDLFPNGARIERKAPGVYEFEIEPHVIKNWRKDLPLLFKIQGTIDLNKNQLVVFQDHAAPDWGKTVYLDADLRKMVVRHIWDEFYKSLGIQNPEDWMRPELPEDIVYIESSPHKNFSIQFSESRVLAYSNDEGTNTIEFIGNLESNFSARSLERRLDRTTLERVLKTILFQYETGRQNSTLSDAEVYELRELSEQWAAQLLNQPSDPNPL